MTPIKLHQLKAFKEVAEQGSIRAASRSLGLSQPSVSKNIKELEESLGVSLFSRHSSGITLTLFGEDFFRHVLVILRELEQAQENIRQHLGSNTGMINIGMGASLANSLLPAAVVLFRKEFPNVKLMISEGQVEAHLLRLQQGEFDFCINTASPELNSSKFDFERLLDMEYRIYARTGHSLSQATKLSELKDCNWILPVMRTGYHKHIFDYFTQHGLNPNIEIYSSSYMVAVELLKKTNCLSVLASALSIEGITPLPMENELPLATYYLVKRKGTLLSPIANKFASLFRMLSRPMLSR
ncbi:MAG: LysR family transcriptional regulator [Enterobacteriaceae bacterium]|jgi:LysR family transcriptional regulator of abg operon|nr:LysR family transcriptional regulator [Enterobacteriaceae bacterium]